MFTAMAVDSSVRSIVVMFHYYWRIRKLWSSFTMLYNNNIIAHNHHTHNNPSFYISTSAILQFYNTEIFSDTSVGRI